MPEIHRSMGCGEQGLVRCKPERVEVAGAPAAGLHCLSVRILDGETIGVKFNRDIVITSEFSDREKVFDQGRANENIMKL